MDEDKCEMGERHEDLCLKISSHSKIFFLCTLSRVPFAYHKRKMILIHKIYFHLLPLLFSLLFAAIMIISIHLLFYLKDKLENFPTTSSLCIERDELNVIL